MTQAEALDMIAKLQLAEQAMEAACKRIDELKAENKALKESQRQWVGLTPQERDEINEQVYGAVPHHVAFHHAIEAKLKEKNTP